MAWSWELIHMPFESEAFTTQLAKAKGRGATSPPRPQRHDKDAVPPPLGEEAKKKKGAKNEKPLHMLESGWLHCWLAGWLAGWQTT